MAENSIVLVTGGNTGIGYESVKALYASSTAYTILMGSRSLDKAHTSIATIQSEVPDSKSEIVALQIDVEDDASISAAFNQVSSQYGKLDTLVNNAGGSHDALLLADPTNIKTRREVWNTTWDLNVTSSEVMSYTFAPLLIKSPSPRLIFVTSGFSSLEVCTVSRSGVLAEMPPAGWPKPPVNTMIAYRAAKAGLNMLMLEWTRLLGADGGRVFCVSPGFVATGFAGMGGKEKMKEKGAKDASFAGSFIRDVVEGKRDGDSGKVVTSGGVQAW